MLLASGIPTVHARTIADIRENARLGELVELTGAVTGIGHWHAIVRDETDGIIVYDKAHPFFCKTGDVLHVSGTVGFTNGILHVMLSQCAKVGTDADAATPIRLTPSDFSRTQGLEHRAVALQGVVADAFRDEFDPAWTFVFFSPLGIHVSAAIYDPCQTLDPSRLVNAEVLVTGTCRRMPGNGRPHLGPLIVSNFPDCLQLLKPPPNDPFLAAEFADASTFRSRSVLRDGHRLRASGTVLATWNGNAFFLETENGLRIRVHLSQADDMPEPGDHVTVAGFPSHNIFFTEFVNALCKKVDGQKIRQTAQPASITPVDLLKDDRNRKMLKYKMDGQLIRVHGKVLSISPADTLRRDIFLLCANETIKVEANTLPVPAVNSEVEITGICRFVGDENAGTADLLRLNSFSILPRTADDIVVIKNPPWWTPLKALIAAIILIALILAAIVWNFILQKLVTRKGRELARESLAHLRAELRTDERTALAVELHDTIAQNLTGVSMQLEGVDTAHRTDSPRLGELISKARHALDSCCTELRSCLWDLRNDAFDSPDVSETVRKAIAPHLGSATADVALDLPRSRISDSTFHALLCIIRELVINAVRHGKATQVDISGELTDAALVLSVKDNGCGFDPKNRPGPNQGHFGLLGIQERLDRIGGTLDITSSPGNGARFTITIAS